jgi:hypothetical protein
VVGKEDLQLVEFARDAAARQARFKIRNGSGGLTRCADGTLSTASGARAQVPAFPLFPRFERWVTVDWPHADPPTRVRLVCTGGDVTFERRTASAGGSF